MTSMTRCGGPSVTGWLYKARPWSSSGHRAASDRPAPTVPPPQISAVAFCRCQLGVCSDVFGMHNPNRAGLRTTLTFSWCVFDVAIDAVKEEMWPVTQVQDERWYQLETLSFSYCLPGLRYRCEGFQRRNINGTLLLNSASVDWVWIVLVPHERAWCDVIGKMNTYRVRTFQWFTK